MSQEVRNITAEYELAEKAAQKYNPGAQPDIVRLMRSAYTHGYVDALLKDRPQDRLPSKANEQR